MVKIRFTLSSSHPARPRCAELLRKGGRLLSRNLRNRVADSPIPGPILPPKDFRRALPDEGSEPESTALGQARATPSRGVSVDATSWRFHPKAAPAAGKLGRLPSLLASSADRRSHEKHREFGGKSAARSIKAGARSARRPRPLEPGRGRPDGSALRSRRKDRPGAFLNDAELGFLVGVAVAARWSRAERRLRPPPKTAPGEDGSCSGDRRR